MFYPKWFTLENVIHIFFNPHGILVVHDFLSSAEQNLSNFK